MAGFEHVEAHGQLTVDYGPGSVDLMDFAWRVTNLLEVESVAVRGSSRTIPKAPGRKSRKRIIDELSVALDMVVRSDCTTAGAVFTETSRAAQLAVNLRALKVIAAPPDDHDGATFTYTANDGTGYTARGWIEGWDVAPKGLTMASVGFDLVIPDGEWTAL